MTILADDVGNCRQMYIINCMNVPKQSLFKRMRTFYDVHKWLDDVEVEQVVLRRSEKCTKAIEKNCELTLALLSPSKDLIGAWSIVTPSVSTWVIVC